MFFWLRFYQKAAGKSLYKSFAFDMIVGTILGILICVLQTPFSYGAVVALPLLATISLFLNWHISGSQTEQTEPQLEKPIVALPKKSVFRYFLMTIFTDGCLCFRVWVTARQLCCGRYRVDDGDGTDYPPRDINVWYLSNAYTRRPC